MLAIGLVALALFVVMRQPVTRPPFLKRAWVWFGVGLVSAAMLGVGSAGLAHQPSASAMGILTGFGVGLGGLAYQPSASAMGILAGFGGLLGLVSLIGLATSLLQARELSWRQACHHWPVLLGALLSLLLIIFEGLVGGVQVLLGLTAGSTNPARGFVQGVHLANTFALLGALLLTAVWASGGPRLRLKGQGALGWLAGVGLVLMLILGMAGAVTALGDLLFTPTGMTPLDTVRQDFSLSASIIQNLRVVHPVLALGVSAYLFWFAGLVGNRKSVSGSALEPRRWKISLHAIIALQILAGVLNVILKAPGWMQMLHLFLACMMWLGVVMLCYSALVGRPAVQTAPSAEGPQGVPV